MSVTLGMPHFDRSALKDVASENMDCMLVALGMSHFEMSTLKDVASDNMAIGSGTRYSCPSQVYSQGHSVHSPSEFMYCVSLHTRMSGVKNTFTKTKIGREKRIKRKRT